MPTNPSSHVSGLNPLVERAILRCLDPDPSKRPASASALAAALPGGDPLAMAVAAGDTPSPEMVAAAGSDAGLRPAVAGPLLAVALVGALAVAALASHVSVQRIAAPAKPPAVLVERARDIVRSAGLESLAAQVQDEAWGIVPNLDYLNYRDAQRPAGAAARVEQFGTQVWYRASPVPFERWSFLNEEMTPRVRRFDPPVVFSGELRITLDPEGRLLALDAIPPQKIDAAPASDVDWSPLFKAAGLDPAEWTSANPQWTPQFFADRQFAWVPQDPSAVVPLRVEAASFQGKPFSFQLIYPWSNPYFMTGTRRTPGQRVADLIAVLILTGVIIGSAIVARRNLRLDRADWQGAVRLAAFTAVADDADVGRGRTSSGVHLGDVPVPDGCRTGAVLGGASRDVLSGARAVRPPHVAGDDHFVEPRHGRHDSRSAGGAGRALGLRRRGRDRDD